MEDQIKNFCELFQEQKDEIILKALGQRVGWKSLNLARKGLLKVYPDGTQVFSYDGVDILEFQKPEWKTEETDEKTSVTITQKYRIL